MPSFNYEENSFVKTVLWSLNVCVHILLGAMVAIPILFAVSKEFHSTSPPDNVIIIHILFCVLGYQLLMSQSFLGLCSYNTWSSALSKVNKRRAHWILQLLGSALAITGSVVIMIYKEYNLNSTHGRLGLAALIFTSINLLTGVPALYAQALKRFIPVSVSKLSHIICGITAFALAASCLCYGYNKHSFRTWTSDRVTSGVIAFTCIFTFAMLINPFITLGKRTYTLYKVFRNEY